MSKLYPEPGEIWATKERHYGGDPNRPMRAVRVLSVPDLLNGTRPIKTGYVTYEYLTGPNARLRGVHKIDTFIQRYERTKEAQA